MENFTYLSPTSVSDAVSALSQTDDGKFLAGGQSLLPIMKLDLAAPTTLVGLNQLESLTGIDESGGALTVGAMSTHAEVHESAVVRGSIPSLADLAGGIGDAQVRNLGTLGGSVAHADPAADYPAALLALNATVVTDRREIAADDFFTGMFATALDEGELITAVRFQVPLGASYAKFANPASKYAVVGVMVARTADGVRVGVTGATGRAHRFADMEAALTADFSEGAVDTVSVPTEHLNDDPGASAAYRAHLVKVMTKRAVRAVG
jgi:carbon-monoxide dehydrogenase medium subunit